MSCQERAIDQVVWSQFEQPDAFHWPGYMWLWLDQMSRDGIFSQLETFARIGARSVWILPEDKAWRAYRQPTELEPAFMTEPFKVLFRETLAEAERLGLRVWLNDEPGFPSGGNVGRIVKASPELIQKRLSRQLQALKGGETYVVPPDCLAAFAGQRRLYPGDSLTADSDITVELFYAQAVCSDNTPNYTDLLHPETARQFVAQCHEAWKEVAGDHFGHLVPIMFFDEPKVSNPPWTDGLAEAFLAEKGYDILTQLPQLFSGDERSCQVRIDFFDWWTRRLAESFFAPIQAWCGQNQLLSTGHFGGDDYTLGNSHHGYGHILRLLRKTDIPCVDAIWHQIWPGERQECDANTKAPNHHFPKYASSVAHQTDRTFAGTESFAVYGSGLTHDHMLWITHYQFVRGINLMAMSNALSSTRDYFAGRIRPTFVPLEANPLNAYLDLYHAYTARLSYLLSRGRPDVTVALYFPIRDIWAGGETAASAAAAHDRLAEALLERQVDFDLVDDDILADPACLVHDGCLQAGPMHYKTVCLAPARHLSPEARVRLAQLTASGGRVIWTDATGHAADLHGIRPLVEAQPRQTKLRVCRRVLDDGHLYFLCNEDTGPLDCTVTFAEKWPLYVLDPATGQAWRPAGARQANGRWDLPLQLPFAGACLVLFGAEPVPTVAEPAKPGDVIRLLADGWHIRAQQIYRVGDHDFEVEAGEEPFLPTELGDWTLQLGAPFSGDAAYKLVFFCTPDEAENAAVLDLGQVNFACRVTLNGHELGRRAWGPFRFPVSSVLRAGENDLTVVVSNSMANQFVRAHVLDKWPENVIGPYHRIAKRFEEETVARGSGLYGPVCLCRAGRS